MMILSYNRQRTSVVKKSKENRRLEFALKECHKAAEKGYEFAKGNIKHTSKAVKESEAVLLETLHSVEKSDINSTEIVDDIRAQLNKVIIDLAKVQKEISHDLKKRKEHLSTFNVSLFGRTMAGKSTIMEILTRGDGKSIGQGGQRTTRDVRT